MSCALDRQQKPSRVNCGDPAYSVAVVVELSVLRHEIGVPGPFLSRKTPHLSRSYEIGYPWRVPNLIRTRATERGRRTGRWVQLRRGFASPSPARALPLRSGG